MLSVVVGLCLILITATAKNNVRQPFGSKMCEQFCHHIGGCSRYLYNPSYLSCDVRDTRKNTPVDVTYMHPAKKVKDRKDADGRACSDLSKIFRTRRRKIICRNQYRLPGKVGTMTRLLVMLSVSLDKRPPPVRQLHLQNHVVNTYPPILRLRYVSAVTYIPTLRKIVIASGEKKHILSIPLDSKTTTVAREGLLCKGIAFDDVRQSLLLSVSDGVSEMSTDGKTLRIIKKLKGCRGGIAVDPAREILYLTRLKKDLLKITYNGTLKVIKKGNIGEPLMADIKGDALYFFVDMRMLILSLSKNVIAVKERLSFSPFSFYVTGNTMYMTYNHKSSVFVLTNFKNKKEINLGFDTPYSSVRLCAVP